MGLAKLPGVCAGTKGESVASTSPGHMTLLCPSAPHVNRLSVYHKQSPGGGQSEQPLKGPSALPPEGPPLSPQLDCPWDTGLCHGQKRHTLHPSRPKGTPYFPAPGLCVSWVLCLCTLSPILSIYLPTCPSIPLSFHLSICPPTHLSTCLPIYPIFAEYLQCVRHCSRC